MIDLHTHTTYSDGTDSVKELLIKANNQELEITNNTFVMPEGKVIIKATFKRLTNPETASVGYTIVFIILIAFLDKSTKYSCGYSKRKISGHKVSNSFFE